MEMLLSHNETVLTFKQSALGFSKRITLDGPDDPPTEKNVNLIFVGMFYGRSAKKKCLTGTNTKDEVSSSFCIATQYYSEWE